VKPPSVIQARWAGGNRFDAGRPGRQTIRIDGSSETGPGPVDTLLCALCACTAEDVLSILEKRRTPATALTVDATGTRADAVPARVTAIDLTYRIDGEGVEEEHALRAVQLAVEKYCSVRETLDKAMPITFRVVINGAR
jgi:putative redox protein